MDCCSLVTSFIVALSVVVVYYHLKVFSFWRSRGVPGPMPWPIFGTSIYYLLGKKLQVERKWRQQYGRTYGLFEGYSPFLKTSDCELIKRIYVKQFSSFGDRDSKFVYGETRLNWLLSAKGPAWANRRALVSPMFSSAKMRLMFSKMANCVDRFMNDVDRRLRETPKGHAELNKGDISSMTLDIIASCFFSLKLDTYDKNKTAKNSEFLKRAFEFSEIDLSHLLVWLLTPKFIARPLEINLSRDSKLNYFIQLSKQIIDDRRQNSTRNKKVDLIQAFLEARIADQDEQVFTQEDDREAHYSGQTDHKQLESLQRKQTGESKLFRKFSDVEICGQMTFFFMAGFETTATTLNFALMELAHHPEIQEQLHRELQARFAPHSDFSQFEFVEANYADLLDCPLLDAFISESMRLHSPILDLNRVVTEQEGVWLSLPGIARGEPIHLPADLTISTNPYIVQRDPGYFEQPDELVLGRFLAQNRDNIKACTFLPFGVGPRHCAGIRFALLENKLALAKIISRHLILPGPKSDYPPTIVANPIFLIAQNPSFKLTPRA